MCPRWTWRDKGLEGDNLDVLSATFVSNEGHEMAKLYNVPGHGHFLHWQNLLYHCPYDCISNSVNDVYKVYKITAYPGSDKEHYYICYCGLGKHVCFLDDERTMRVYGAATGRSYIDVKDFLASYYNLCQKYKWNIVYVVVYDQIGKANVSSLWVNHDPPPPPITMILGRYVKNVVISGAVLTTCNL